MDRDLITALTVMVRVYRELRQMGVYDQMPIELKGLRAKAMKARANLDALNASYDKFNEAAPAHLADVDAMTSQIGIMTEDLEFATALLGNSGGATEAEERTAPPPGQSSDPAAEPAPGAAADPAGTFRG